MSRVMNLCNQSLLPPGPHMEYLPAVPWGADLQTRIRWMIGESLGEGNKHVPEHFTRKIESDLRKQGYLHEAELMRRAADLGNELVQLESLDGVMWVNQFDEEFPPRCADLTEVRNAFVLVDRALRKLLASPMPPPQPPGREQIKKEGGFRNMEDNREILAYLVSLKDRIVKHFTKSDWVNLGTLTGSLDRVQ